MNIYNWESFVGFAGLFLLLGLPFVVLPKCSARAMWHINSILRRLIVMSLSLPVLYIASKLSAAMALDWMKWDRNAAFEHPVWISGLGLVLVSFWSLFLGVGILAVYAITIVLLVWPKGRLTRWLSRKVNSTLRVERGCLVFLKTPGSWSVLHPMP
jgi:membrane protein YdbS with pleckstrin-like domain